jgi:thymidylate synthase (FAD)
MDVTMLARTFLSAGSYELNAESTQWQQTATATERWLATEDDVRDADTLGEFAGRACYQSWDRPNPKTATNESYLRHIIDVGHESVLAHASVTFYVTGVSRALTHELVRHRFLAVSQLSQRYVDNTDADPVLPPALDSVTQLVARFAWQQAQKAYQDLTRLLRAEGLSHKQVREAARAVLPNMTETRLVVSGNLRAWRDFIKQRNTDGADAEIRLLAQEILRQLKTVAPNSFQDLEP